jgi:integrase
MSKKYSLDYIIRKDKINDKGECPIVLRYTYNRKYYRIPLGYSVGIEEWDDVNRIPKTSFKGFKTTFMSMMELTRKMELLIDNETVKFGNPPSIEKLKLLLKGNEESHKSTDSLLLTPLIRSFVDKKKEDPQVRSATLSIYETTYQKWVDYEKTKSPFKINEFSFEDLERFQIVLKNQGLMFSTVGKYIKTMKTFLNHITSNMNIPIDISYKKVKVEREEENNFVVLTEYELELIRKSISYTRYEVGETSIKLDTRERLIGRMFWFMCVTGVNYIDMLNLSLHDISFESKEMQKRNSNEIPDPFVLLSFNRQKSTKPISCKIPIHGHLIELLLALINPQRYGVLTVGDNRLPEKFLKIKLKQIVELCIKDSERFKNKNYKIFPYIPNSSFNKEIKNLCEKLGFDETKELKLKKKDSPSLIKRKFDFITARTGRRTFITICLKKGIRPDILMKATGHLKMDTMRRYNLYTNQSINEEFEQKIFNNEA